MQAADIAWIIAFLVITIVDVWFVIRQVPTLSNRFKFLGRHVSMLPYSWGALGGHFTGPVDEFIVKPPSLSVAILVGLGVAISLGHWIARRFWDTPKWLPYVYFLTGSVAGVFLVPV